MYVCVVGRLPVVSVLTDRVCEAEQVRGNVWMS